MKKLADFINYSLIASWIGAIAIFSIQNVQSVSLRFFTWESVSLPIGVLLAFCVGFGLILSVFLSLLWQK